MKNKIEEYMDKLPSDVRNVVEEVIKAELEKLDMQKPQGIKKEIGKIIQDVVKGGKIS